MFKFNIYIMKKIFLFTFILFLGFKVHGQEENIQKVQIVKDSSFKAAYPKGENEIRLNALSFLVEEDLNLFYERILNKSSSLGISMFINAGDEGMLTDRKFAVNPYYRFYFYNSKEYGARGFFVEGFSSFASVKNESLQVSLGMTIGQKWVTTNGFSFELFVGLARYITDTVLEAHAPVGIAIGKRF
jgi:hypothetical protein